MQIMLADDHDNRFFFTNALTEIPLYAQFSTVDDDEKLMQLLSDDAFVLPDVLLLNIIMSGKNGFECLVEIKDNKKLNDFPDVMISVSNSREKINKVFKNVVNVYIHNPNDFNQLKQLILFALPISIQKLVPSGELKYILNA